MTHADVRVYEVGPRDGLQNESLPIPTPTKLQFIDLLADAETLARAEGHSDG